MATCVVHRIHMYVCIICVINSLHIVNVCVCVMCVVLLFVVVVCDANMHLAMMHVSHVV